jgi:hypothetical protein
MSLNLLPATVTMTPLNGLFNYDVLTQVVYFSNVDATGDYQINFRGNGSTTLASVVPVGMALEVLLFVKSSATIPYNLTSITIDGTLPNFFGWLRAPVTNNTTKYAMTITQVSPGNFYVA